MSSNRRKSKTLVKETSSKSKQLSIAHLFRQQSVKQTRPSSNDSPITIEDESKFDSNANKLQVQQVSPSSERSKITGSLSMEPCTSKYFDSDNVHSMTSPTKIREKERSLSGKNEGGTKHISRLSLKRKTSVLSLELQQSRDKRKKVSTETSISGESEQVATVPQCEGNSDNDCEQSIKETSNTAPANFDQVESIVEKSDSVKSNDRLSVCGPDCEMVTISTVQTSQKNISCNVKENSSNTMNRCNDPALDIGNNLVKKGNGTDQNSNSQSLNERSEESTDVNDENVDKTSSQEEYKVPYYLENFLLIVNKVANDDFFRYLFNEEDERTIDAFLSLTETEQKVFVRLFGRQYRWIRLGKIVYPNIAADLKEYLENLVKTRLLMGSDELTDLQDTLKALPAPELKDLAKSLKINHSQIRTELMTSILKHSKKAGICSFFKTSKDNTSNTSSIVLRRAIKLLGPVYKLRKCSRNVFMRILMLFGLHRTHGEEDETGKSGSEPIFQMLMSNIGRVKYPQYTVNRTTKIFRDRTDLIKFSEALQHESELGEALENKDYETAEEIFLDAKGTAENLWTDESEEKHAKRLPDFLRRFTAASVYSRVLSQGVELLQYMKNYNEAVSLLQYLIHQDTYHTDYRGRWYDRLALNLDFHMKQPAKALDTIVDALADPCVQVGHRLSLYQRAHKICHTGKKNRAKWTKFDSDSSSAVKDAPKNTITAMKMPTADPNMHAFYVWVVPDEHGETTLMKRVEDVALHHYSGIGYTDGIHGEGRTFTTLFGIFFWDQIYRDDIPDVFYHEYLTCPMDLRSEHFYTARKEHIDARTAQIKDMSNDELCTEVVRVWDTHQETLCSVIGWELFDSVDHFQGLVCCMGGFIVSRICDRLAKNMRFVHSGVPDLVVWNKGTGKFKVVEVKGPGDRLSTKQILWLDYLMQLGVEAEVCHVEGVSTKKIH